MINLKRESNEDITQFIDRVLNTRNQEKQEIVADFSNGVILNTADCKDENDLSLFLTAGYVNDYGSDVIPAASNAYDSLNLRDVKPLNNETLSSVDDLIPENNTEHELKTNQISLSAIESLQLLTNYVISVNNFDEIDLAEYQELDAKLEETKMSYNNILELKKAEKEDKLIKIRAYMDKAEELREKHNLQCDKDIAALTEEKEEYNKIISEYQDEQSDLDMAYADLKQKLKSPKFSDDLDMINVVSKVVDKNLSINEAIAILGKHLNKIDLMSKVSNLSKESENQDVTSLDAVKMMTIADSSQELLTDLKKICKLRWNVEAYEEYISGLYPENYLEEINAKIETAKDSKQSFDEFKANVDEYTLSILTGSTIDENGRILYDLERDDPLLKSQREKIKKLEELALAAKKSIVHPTLIRDEIMELMNSNANEELISNKLDILLSFIDPNVSVIKETFDSEKGELVKIEEKLDRIVSDLNERVIFYNSLLKDHDDELYINDDEYINDQALLETYKDIVSDLDRQILRVERILAKKENNKELKRVTSDISKLEVAKYKIQDEKVSYINNIKGDLDSTKMHIFNDTIEFYDQSIARLSEKRKQLLSEISKAKGFATTRKLEKLRAEKIRNEKNIQSMEEMIRNKKENYGYINPEVKSEIENEISDLVDEMELLNNLRTSINTHTIEGLKNNILNYNKVETRENEFDEDPLEIDDFEENISEEELEEIDSFELAPKGIIERIKSGEFKEIANAAIVRIVTTVGALVAGTAILIGSHFVKEKDASEEVNKLSRLNETTNVTQESIDMKNGAIASEINELVNSDTSDIKIHVEEQILENNEEKENENFVNVANISADKYSAAEGNFINQENINVENFQNDNIQRFEYMDVDGKLVRLIYGKNGTPEGEPIGYENVSVEENIEGKTR